MEQNEDTGTRKDLVSYKLESAKDCIESAKILLDAGKYKAANNRAYYAIFHAINAVHATKGVAYKRHKDTLANFNKEFVNTGIFPKDIGRKIYQAEEIRHDSDYDDFYIATREEAETQISTAEELFQLVTNYCAESIEDD